MSSRKVKWCPPKKGGFKQSESASQKQLKFNPRDRDEGVQVDAVGATAMTPLGVGFM